MSSGTIEEPGPAESNTIVLYDVSWEFYERFLDEIEEKTHVRLVYDDGALEIIAPPQLFHEHTKRLLGRMVDTLTEEFDLPVLSAGSMTLKRETRRKGLNPDECYYIENESAVRGKRRIYLDQDPPPDLGIEVEDTSSSLDRMSVYAALGVSELWQFQISRLTLHVLSGGEYLQVEESPHFPGIQVDDLNRFLRSASATDETTWIRGFREWVREQIGGSQT